MLGKLLKYDLKWVYKGLIVFYILAIIFSLIARGLSMVENSLVFEILTQFSYGVATAMIANCLINNLMRMWVRFIRNTYKDESYLTHTLPVSKKTIYLSKFLTAIITMVTSTIVIVVCLGICYYSQANLEILKSALELAANVYNSTVLSFVLMILGIILLQMIFIILVGYVAIILGHKSNNKKMIKSVIYGFLLYMGAQIFSIIVLFVVGTFSPDIMNLLNTTKEIDINLLKQIMTGVIGLYIVYILVYYKIGEIQLKKGVNID